jgi:hypothetical protein
VYTLLELAVVMRQAKSDDLRKLWVLQLLSVTAYTLQNISIRPYAKDAIDHNLQPYVELLYNGLVTDESATCWDVQNHARNSRLVRQLLLRAMTQLFKICNKLTLKSEHGFANQCILHGPSDIDVMVRAEAVNGTNILLRVHEQHKHSKIYITGIVLNLHLLRSLHEPERNEDSDKVPCSDGERAYLAITGKESIDSTKKQDGKIDELLAFIDAEYWEYVCTAMITVLQAAACSETLCRQILLDLLCLVSEHAEAVHVITTTLQQIAAVLQFTGSSGVSDMIQHDIVYLVYQWITQYDTLDTFPVQLVNSSTLLEFLEYNASVIIPIAVLLKPAYATVLLQKLAEYKGVVDPITGGTHLLKCYVADIYAFSLPLCHAQGHGVDSIKYLGQQAIDYVAM